MINGRAAARGAEMARYPATTGITIYLCDLATCSLEIYSHEKYIFLPPLIGCLECLATHTSPLIGWRGGWPLPGPPGHTRPPGPLPPAPWLLASPGQEGALLTRPSPVSTAVLDPRPALARLLSSPVWQLHIYSGGHLLYSV